MFSVDLATGRLSFDDALHPATTKLANGTNLMINGNGSYYIEKGNVFVDDSLFARIDRRVHIRATITFEDYSVVVLNNEDCVRYKSASDVGAAFPYGATPVSTHTLVIANAERGWDTGGARLGNRSFDGADVMVELGAEDYNGAIQYTAMGRFLVDTVDNQHHQTVVTLSGNDYMGNKMMAEFVDISSYPAGYESSNVVELACNLAGVSYDLSALPYFASVVKPAFTSKVTCRDVVGWIAQMHQSAVYMDGNGVLRFAPLITGTGTYKIQPPEFMQITTSIPFNQYNYRLEAKTFDGSATYVVEYEPNPGSSFYSFSIVLSPFMVIGANTESYLTQFYIESAGSILNAVTSGFVTWRGGEFMPLTQHITVVKPNGSTVIYLVFQNRVNYDGSLVCETGIDLNSLTKNLTEGKS